MTACKIGAIVLKFAKDFARWNISIILHQRDHCENLATLFRPSLYLEELTNHHSNQNPKPKPLQRGIQAFEENSTGTKLEKEKQEPLSWCSFYLLSRLFSLILLLGQFSNDWEHRFLNYFDHLIGTYCWGIIPFSHF